MRFIALPMMLAALIAAGASRTSNHPTVADGAYYGVNYTVPFAHAYRALGDLGVDRKEAIDRDVYHIARMGLNAFRLHLWDVELADGEGNLLEKNNEHLDLLDYLIAQLEKRGVAVVLTAQTNFGNGYPERNTDPNGAFSYKYGKCDVHDNPAARAAQERYLRALVGHVNPYTGRSYADDPDILAIEINNEPCHSGSAAQITAYIDQMAAALRDAGWKKEILYNVSHNLDRVEAYYDAADIDGTTYQWYPTGLVRSSQRHGNFLPMLDSYDIPWDTIPGFDRLSRVVYEYDPADVLDTYLYPAATRTFRKAGFSWATQFAYDPIDMARFNTEYQTHFLNLGYTPGKAVGMMIAAEAMRQIPKGANYGKYPQDTVFGDRRQFLVSAKRNLAMLNDGERYYHTNSTGEAPVTPKKLRALAGVGSSPIVATDGTGAYFLDRLPGGVWRLEVMPDVIITDDPFAKPSLTRDVAVITNRLVGFKIDAHALGLKGPIYYKCIVGDGDSVPESAEDDSLLIAPGVYLLADSEKALNSVKDDQLFGLGGNMAVSEYVAPFFDEYSDILVHQSPAATLADRPLVIRALWASDEEPDSIVVFPASASFWKEKNDLFTMKKVGKYEYETQIPAKTLSSADFAYRIVVYYKGEPTTYPSASPGTPLDWDFPETDSYRLRVYQPGAPVELLRPTSDMDGSEITTIPEGWRGVGFTFDAPLAEAPRLTVDIADTADTDTAVVTKYVAPVVKAVEPDEGYNAIRLYVGEKAGAGIKASVVNDDGFTYSVSLPEGDGGIVELPLSDFVLDATVLAPAPYPAFLGRYFRPDAATATPLSPANIESITFTVPRGTRIGLLGAELIKK